MVDVVDGLAQSTEAAMNFVTLAKLCDQVLRLICNRAALIYEQNKVRELNKELEIQSLGNQQLTSRCSQLLTELEHLKEKFIQSSEIIM